MQPTFESRTEIPTEFKWDLSPIFVSKETWEKSRDHIKSNLRNIEQFRAHVKDSAENLAGTLIFMSSKQEQVRKLSDYAPLSADEDPRISLFQGMKQEG